MNTKSDYDNADEFGNLHGTKYWFKRDLGTIKAAIKSTLKFSPIILILATIFSALFVYIESQRWDFSAITLLTTLLFPITIFGYFICYVFKNKGYEINEHYTELSNPADEIRLKDHKNQKINQKQ